MVRAGAIDYLQRCGGIAEAAKVVPLLSDKDSYIRKTAAKTLAKIGAQDGLATIDTWLKAGSYPDPRDGASIIV